jgi:hypothetical protein
MEEIVWPTAVKQATLSRYQFSASALLSPGAMLIELSGMVFS